jgi:hypothetical protein
MAFSYGRKFRRIAAAALTADPAEMRASIERILPPRGENAAPVLRLETEEDHRTAPAAIVAAFFADKLTGGEAAILLGQVGTKESLARVAQARQAEVTRQRDIRFLRALVEGPRMWGNEAPLELVRSINMQLVKLGAEPFEMPCCGAASEGAAIVCISENTIAGAGGNASG